MATLGAMNGLASLRTRQGDLDEAGRHTLVVVEAIERMTESVRDAAGRLRALR